MRRLAWLAGGLLSLLLMLMPAHGDRVHAHLLKEQLAATERRQPGAEMPCVSLGAQRPIVLLVLGQSNAANHGSSSVRSAPIPFFLHGRCYAVRDPLPGGSGEGASLWPLVAVELGGQLRGRPLLFAQLAVENTTIDDWTRPGPLHQALRAELASLAQAGLAVDLVLWQQGEADAKAHTSTQAYRKGLAELWSSLDAGGLQVPVVAALSTYCPGSDGSMVRAAIRQFARSGRDFIIGPDTDALQGAMRSGCHFSEAGLHAAAADWALSLRALKIALR